MWLPVWKRCQLNGPKNRLWFAVWLPELIEWFLFSLTVLLNWTVDRLFQLSGSSETVCLTMHGDFVAFGSCMYEMHTHRRTTKNAATLAASLMFTSRAHVHTHITTQAQFWSYRYFEAGWLLMFPIPLPISFTLVSPKPPTRSIPWMAKKVCVENWWLTIWKEATI